MNTKPEDIVSFVIVFVFGLMIGVFLHYTLHCLMLPSQPFIYVIF